MDKNEFAKKLKNVGFDLVEEFEDSGNNHNLYFESYSTDSCFHLHVRATANDSYLGNVRIDELNSALPIINQYLKSRPQPRYTVQVLKSNDGYLGRDRIKECYFIDYPMVGDDYQVAFTQAEINQMRQNDNLAIDWAKVTIKREDSNG